LDTGPILSQKPIKISENDTAGTLSQKLADLGADLLVETLPRYLEGQIKPTPQDEKNASYAPMLKKSDGKLDFNLPAEVLARKVRAFQPWPGTYTELESGRLKVLRASTASPEEVKGLIGPGEPAVHNGSPAIGSGYGLLILDEVQPAGKKAMSGKAFLAGARDWI
jgi:methionyl-tRNA formyltransferase